MSPWLAGAYAVLALGLGWTLTSGPRWRRRIPFIVGAPALAVALWLDRPNAAGWPSAAKTPNQASLVWASVDEPDPQSADPGHIYLWLDVGAAAPRAYELPYSRPLEERVQRALQAIKQHRSIQMTRSTSTHRGTARNGSARRQQSGQVQFRSGRTILPTKPKSDSANAAAP
jgi:hypothetical protein